MRRLRWNRVERGCAAAAQVAVVYPLYLLGIGLVLAQDDRAQLIDVAFVRGQVPVFAGVSLGALGLWVLGLWLRRRHPDVLWYQHVTAQYFAVSLVWAGYITGTLNFAAGVVLMGAAVTGYIVLERRVILPAVIHACVLLIAFTLATAGDLLPYAPALVPPDSRATQLFWLYTHLFLAVPHLGFCFLATVVMLRQWRRSEARVLRLGTTDGLTGLYNRRSMLHLLNRAQARARDTGAPLAVALLDLDHFKRINDIHGHLTGDRALRAVADCLAERTRTDELVSRFGGEEFLVALPDTGPAMARARMESIREAVEGLDLVDEQGAPVALHTSIGVAAHPGGSNTDADALVATADQALHEAKQAGRNRVKYLDQGASRRQPESAGFCVRHGEPGLPSTPQPEFDEARAWLRRRITGLNRISETAMATLMLALISVQYTGFLGWSLVALAFDDRARWIHTGRTPEAMVFMVVSMLLGLMLAGVGLWLYRRGRDSRPFVLLAHQYYGLTLVGFGYLIGLLSLPAGVVLLASPLLGVLFFRTSTVIQGFATSMVVFLAANFAAALGWIPYAPLVTEATVHYRDAEPFWVLSFLYFVVPMVVFTLVLLDVVMRLWRRRGRYIHSLSVTDPLTEVNNRRKIMALLEHKAGEARRQGRPLTVLLLDVDFFKSINDGHGHPVGDRVLKRIAATLMAHRRSADAVGRFGGEEFLVVLPDTPLEGAVRLAERYRALLSELELLDDENRPFRVTASVGVARFDPLQDTNAEAMVGRADAALYRAKEDGRNRIETLEPEPEQAPAPPAV